jgi:PAS domain S-box-containing protein
MKNDDVLIDILNIETGTRGYVITGKEIFLGPYIKSANKINENLKLLKNLSKENPSQLIRIKALKEFIDKRLLFSKEMILKQKAGQWTDDERIIMIEKGRFITDTIRTIINNINSEELLMLKHRKIENEKINQTSDISFVILLFLIIVIFTLILFILKNYKKRNIEIQEFIAEQKLLSKYSLSLIEASLDPLVTINTEGKITDMNEATVTITGIEREKLIGTDFFDYFTESQKAREVYQKVFAEGSVADSPLTLRHKEGKLTDVLFNGSVYKDDLGNVLGVVIVARDIAEQKWALDLKKANIELAFQNDERGKRADELSIANEELAFQNDEKQKRADELSIANEELAFQNDEKQKRADELSIANEELAFQNDEKQKRADELSIANEELAFQNDEKQKRADELSIANEELAFQNDEKEKRKIENEELEALSNSLKLASQYSLSLIEASRDPLFTISTKGKITDTNEASVRVTGVAREQLIGSDFFDYFTDPEKAREGYSAVFSEGFVVDYPLTIRDDQFTDVLFNGSIYKDEQGNVLGAVVVARDITEQKRIEREFIEAKVFAELATKIAEEEKRKAQSATKIAEIAVKSKQQFLSNMSHEIRTPMNAIIGFTKVVLKTDLNPKQKEYLNAIKISGNALIVLINDILDLAKVDAGKMQFEQIPFKMRSSIDAMMHLFESKIQEKNLNLIREFDSKIPEVLVGDPVRLHQIILNLVSNAVKFTSKGKITVSVKQIEEDETSVILEFAVSDTGIGISETKIETVFENFQQATSGTSRLYGGTGLGLAIVKQLVEPQGGTIHVESIVNEGSTFSFKLPFLKTKAEAQTELELIELDSELKNLRVLVVEDMVLNQLLMKTVLDDFGFERDIADNGKIAIEKLKTNTYDIILMDLQMPEMNGFDATEYIRNTLKLTIPIIALTADVTTVDLEKCKSVGMNDYLAKPIDERILYSKIVSLIKKNNVSNEDNFTKPILAEIEKIKYIDLVYLNQRTKSNPILMAEMITIYLQQTPPLINAMKQSFKNKDWEKLHSAVHKMIPSFSIMGIHIDFENMAKKVQEFAVTQQEEHDINDMVMQLETVLHQSCNELKEELNRIKNIQS